MTREKAIEILKLYKQRLEEAVSTELGNDIKAFEMAISSLENNYNSAEQTDGDLISRQDAEGIFREARRQLKPQDYKTAYEFNTRDLILLNAEQLIHQLPPVTPQPSAEKTAEWILKDGIYGVVYCSKCDYELHTNDTNYCPNCGARMKEGDTE